MPSSSSLTLVPPKKMSHVQLPPSDDMFRAVIERDSGYEGLFYVAVRTTGIFCRPTCPAKKPKRQNVEFFPNVADALTAGYRACKRCRPMRPSGESPAWLDELLADVEKDPSHRWTDADLRERSLDPTRVRRWFKTHHGMTFHAYQRARRLGQAFGRIRQGADLLDVAYDSGYESSSAFRDAFHELFGATPGRSRAATLVKFTRILTPLGPVVAGATDEGLCLLEFADRRMLETQLIRLRQRLRCAMAPGENRYTEQVRNELAAYFDGNRSGFDVPLLTPGTDFQRAVWEALCEIPYGETTSYEQLARTIGRPKAMRAVGRANGDNRLAIIIPCHRVIRSNGDLCGYGGGLWRKRYLLQHERSSAAAQV